MPTETEFAFIYQVSGTLGGVMTIDSLADTNATLVDGEDSNWWNGETPVGENTRVYSASPFIHAEGYPIVAIKSSGTEPIVSNGGTYYMFSDTPYSLGSTFLTMNWGSYTYACYAAGSLIATPNGERAVETLEIGDAVLSADGRAVAVKWIGLQTVMTRFHSAERLMPVRFAAGSLGDGLPHTDLTVTADHGMLIDGVICHAGALVNGTTISQVPLAEMGETYTVYHIETEAHEIILANGAPTETFIDNVSRRAFDNYAEFETLYGEVPEMQELPYPRAMSARQVPPRIRARLGIVRAA